MLSRANIAYCLLFPIASKTQLKCLTIYLSAASQSLRAEETNLDCYKID